MTPEEIETKLNNLEEALGERDDALVEANKVRDEVALSRSAIRELAEAIKWIPDAYQGQSSGGSNNERWQIDGKADKVLQNPA